MTKPDPNRCKTPGVAMCIAAALATFVSVLLLGITYAVQVGVM